MARLFGQGTRRHKDENGSIAKQGGEGEALPPLEKVQGKSGKGFRSNATRARSEGAKRAIRRDLVSSAWSGHSCQHPHQSR